MTAATRRDADGLKALAHPLRLRLLDLLHAYGPATVSMLADRTHEAVGSISHHIKSLAAAGLIAPAPELARDRRERWWQAAGGDPAREGLATSAWLTLTTAEVSALGHELRSVIDSWRDRVATRDAVDAQAERVLVLAQALPMHAEPEAAPAFEPAPAPEPAEPTR